MLNNQELVFTGLVCGTKFLVKAADDEQPIFKHELFEAEYIAFFERMGLSVEMLTSKTMVISFNVSGEAEIAELTDKVVDWDNGIWGLFDKALEYHYKICRAYPHHVKVVENAAYAMFS